ncbi:predicted protein [Postia placenta Mad-698-R]|nr:predicted protein [Postia placenta Mad-698-R]
MVLNDVLWSLIVQVALVSFYTLRIWNLSENNAWISALVASSLFDLYTLLRLRTFDELNALKELLMSVYAIAAAGDLLIAITLSVLLHGSRTGYRRSDGLINKLIAVLPTAFIYVAFFFLMGRLHTNSLLATLNARKILRVRTVGDDVLSLSLQDLQGSDTLASGRRNVSQLNTLALPIGFPRGYLLISMIRRVKVKSDLSAKFDLYRGWEHWVRR